MLLNRSPKNGKNMDFKQFSRLIMIEQTVFALPYALIGVLFAGGGNVSHWLWAIIALVAARIAGMAFNRVIDAQIDAKNPRTSDRLIPTGAVSSKAVWITGILASLILMGSAYMLNSLCFRLSFMAVFLLFTYSYFKRFSASSHFYLGFVEAAAPIGGYLAVTGEFSLIPFVLGFAIMTWIAGLDIVYALQDTAFDTEENLHSIPVRIGNKNALTVSSACYICSLTALVYAGILACRHSVYYIAIACIGVIFFLQQRAARHNDIDPSVKTFFRLNMYISPILFVGSFIDVYFL